MDLGDNLEINFKKKLEGILALSSFVVGSAGIILSLGYAYTTYLGEIVEKFYSYFP